MYVVVAGAGTVGFQIAKKLIDGKNDVSLIENDPERIRFVSEHLDCMVIKDEADHLSVLKRAGIEKADVFISVTNSDENNMIFCGLVGSEFNVPVKVARVRTVEYLNLATLKKSFLNIDFIVNPEVEAARIIGETVDHGVMSDVICFAKTDVQMRNLFVDNISILKDRTLMDVRKKIDRSFLIAGITRKNTVIIPKGNTVIKEHDTLSIVSTSEILDSIFAKVGRPGVEIKNIIIVGGSRIGRMVAYELHDKKYSLKIIEKDIDRCELLSAQFSDSLILHADVSDESVFLEENLSESDLIITATDSQELNIITAAYAKTIGIKKAIAVVTKSNYVPIANSLGIDATINPKSSAADTILKLVMASNVESIHSIFEGEADVIEFSLGEKEGVTGIPLRDIDLPDGTLLMTVTREGENHIPDGSFILNEGDYVLVIARKKSISQIMNMFSVRI